MKASSRVRCKIDLASRLVFAELRPTLRTADAVTSLERAVAFFDSRGIQVRRVLTDNAHKRILQSTSWACGPRIATAHRGDDPSARQFDDLQISDTRSARERIGTRRHSKDP